MGAAALLWLAVLLYLLRFDGVPLKTFLSAVFFVLFFAVSVDVLRAHAASWWTRGASPTGAWCAPGASPSRTSARWTCCPAR